ncbi:aminodeoxychorismate synthase component I [Williamsia sterculiae]|uniref:aminodeoxychorismate synthase component I n=1 Tax=Williamsia sterculiae TaxID=1344003 RepID=UPI000970BFB2
MERVTALGTGASAPEVTRRLATACRRLRLPPPAGLIGRWLDADAVIAPSVRLTPDVEIDEADSGFWFGYLGYPDRDSEAALPGRVGGHTTGVLILDDGRWWYRDTDGRDCPDWVRAAVMGGEPVRRSSWSARWRAPDPDPHGRGVRACLDAITEGEVYQACVCTRFDGEITGSVVDFFADGVIAHRPRKAAYLAGDWGAVTSFSPETFLHRRGTRVSSSPIKGTIPAGADPAELTASTKDVAENIMIVDLVRNDLGRVAVPGSVRVPELLTVRPAPGVWHLVSTVTATLRPDVDTTALIEATFPPASVTGTPKLRARDLLRGWETHPRGVYCGAIGVRGPEGDLDLSVAIRTVQTTADGRSTLGVGGGITVDSDPAREWQECLDKAASTVGLIAGGYDGQSSRAANTA